MKKSYSIFVGILVLGIIWYFFIKPQDYKINVQAKSFPASVGIALMKWSNSIENSTISKISQNQYLQKINLNDSVHIYDWRINYETDSTSTLKINIKDDINTLSNKLYIPFKDTDFEKGSRKTVIEFIEYLNEEKTNFKVTIIGEENLPIIDCACVKHTATQDKKAAGMMESYPFMNSTLVANGIQLNGVPFIHIKDWNIQNNTLKFDFCYPIIKTNSLPSIQNIFYKQYQGQNSLKAIYNGNYITSDYAWYALLDHAKANNIEVEKNPIEFFYNNPNYGGNAIRWKTEVYMPLKQ